MIVEEESDEDCYYSVGESLPDDCLQLVAYLLGTLLPTGRFTGECFRLLSCVPNFGELIKWSRPVQPPASTSSNTSSAPPTTSPVNPKRGRLTGSTNIEGHNAGGAREGAGRPELEKKRYVHFRSKVQCEKERERTIESLTSKKSV